jgi:TfoX/Sxy family transcriptional regulator of competence genes
MKAPAAKPRPAKQAASKTGKAGRAAAKPARKSTKKAGWTAPSSGPMLDPRLEVLAREYAKEPRVSVGRLFASIGLKVDGKIFAMVVRGQFVVKLPRARVEQLVAQRAGQHFCLGGARVMKEWLSMTASKPDALTLGREAFRFVGGARAR